MAVTLHNFAICITRYILSVTNTSTYVHY